MESVIRLIGENGFEHLSIQGAGFRGIQEDDMTGELKKPFVRGDKARTDRTGSGLGLSIAESALERNGYGLKISSTETEFTAEIRL